MTFPALNLRRVYLIARRDFLGYVKTWGFWISFFLPFVFGALGFFAAQADIKVQPVRYETILDETGQDYGDEIVARFKARRADLVADLPPSIQAPEEKTVFIDPPATTMDALQPYLKGETLVQKDGGDVRLNGVLHLYPQDNPSGSSSKSVAIDYWSPNINNDLVKNLATGYFRDAASARYLESGGLTSEGLSEARKETVDVNAYDPTKTSVDGSQKVTKEDKIPYFVAALLTIMLWLTIFAGSYMLLTSMLEEKLNKLLEMMLASTRFSEIMFGKLLGAAALTVAAMSPYIILGIVTIAAFFIGGDPETVAGLTKAFSAKMIIFFIIYLILGYVFYGAFFIALGAMAESTQDAQTLTTPIMLILTTCIMVVPIGLNAPDSPILEWASWFPLSAPFAAIMKLASDPPLWELALSAFFLFICVIGVVWLASQVFRYGVLSGSGIKEGFKNFRGWAGKALLRRS